MHDEEIQQPVILIVDDNQEILEFLAEDLEDKYVVLSAANVKTAFSLLEKHMVHLIISDIIMPDIDGYTFCNMIKSNIEYSHIPFILLTAKNTLHAKIEGLEKGADAYIEKPFSPAYVRVQISNLLANRNRMRDFFSSYPYASIKTTAHSSADEILLAKLTSLILQFIDNPDLSVDTLADEMHMSRPTLYRKIKTISDLTPNELINLTRLKKAAELLALEKYSINEISIMVGFASATHFGRNFSKHYGMTPSSYAARTANNKR
ncbi:MAG: response regulator [Bacteroidetes bacterium]|nr:response regulator [Bacteroidota bacterium]